MMAPQVVSSPRHNGKRILVFIIIALKSDTPTSDDGHDARLSGTQVATRQRLGADSTSTYNTPFSVRHVQTIPKPSQAAQDEAHANSAGEDRQQKPRVCFQNAIDVNKSGLVELVALRRLRRVAAR
jgi:hypothetical protein